MTYLALDQERLRNVQMRINAPVLFDANILINFKSNLRILFSYFDKILIHQKVYEEIIDKELITELDSLVSCYDIQYVDDNIPTDPISMILFEQCDAELKNSFNISDGQDLGEYKTLLYAKFNNIAILSSQDTTVWRFVTQSTYFKGLDCFTIQDIAYLLYLNAKNKNDRQLAKKIYQAFAPQAHPFNNYKQYMENSNAPLPNFIAYENMRIENYAGLVKSYVVCYDEVDPGGADGCEGEICRAAKDNIGTCINCLFSRSDKNKIDYLIRICYLGYAPNDAECMKEREEFLSRVKNRDNKDER